MPYYDPYPFHPPSPRQLEREKKIGDMIVEGYMELARILHPRRADTEFLYCLSFEDGDGYHSIDLQLPYTEWEMQDAMDRLRPPAGVECKQERLYSKKGYLASHIPDDISLPKLNQLAYRLREMDDFHAIVLEGLVKMEPDEPIPLDRLLCMTYSTGDCHIAYGVHNDLALGKFVEENGLSPELDDMPENLLKHLDHEKVGREHRQNEHGVFTSRGYVECTTWPELSPVPEPAPAPSLEGKSVVLRLSLGYFNDPTYDNERTTTLTLPCTQDEMCAAIEYVGAASIKECGFSCVDCTVPQLKELITDAGPEFMDEIGSLARELVDMEFRGSHELYKALLQATQCGTLENAAALAENVDAYVLRRMHGPEDYAKDVLAAIHHVDGGSIVAQHANLPALGREYMKRDNAVLTNYGIILHGEGEPIIAEEQAPSGPKLEMQ